MHELCECIFGSRPEWALSVPATLAEDVDERVVALASTDLQVPYDECGCFGDACAGVVEEEEEGVFDPASRRPGVGNLEQVVHLGPGEPADGLWDGLFRGDCTDAAAPFEMAWIAAGDEAREGADRREPLVAGLHGAAAVVFEVVEELPYAPGREVLNRDPIDGLADPGANEGEEEGEGIAVALLRVAGEVALGDDVLGEEAAQPGAERAGLTHGLLLR